MKTLFSAVLMATLLTFPVLTKAQNHSDQAVHSDQVKHSDQTSHSDQAKHSDQTSHSDQAKHSDQVMHSAAGANISTGQSGTVEYNEKIVLDIHFEGDAQANMPMLPREHTSKKILYFSPEASLYEGSSEAEEENVEEMEGGHRMVVKIDQPDEKTYVDLINRKIIDQRDFMSRMFLIESPVDSISWKLTGNQREILGYPCSEAVWTKDSVKTIAWFTSAIPVEAGPARFNGLPGLILETITEEGKRIISATSVKLGEVAEKIIRPTKGKKVTREQFNKMVDEKRKESGGEEGGNHVVIRIRQ